ncbi:MAG: glycosyltransferase family 1 protein [Chitinophagaceae bacterium]
MKVGIEVQRLFRRKKHGMEIVALEIIHQLQKSEKPNEYILFVKDDEDKGCLEKSNNLTVNILANATYAIWEQLYLLKALLKTKPDILHCTANTAPLFCKTPLIITIHDVIYMESISFSGSSYQNFGNLYRRFIVPKVAKKAAIILTVSEYEKKVIVNRLNLAEDKVRVIYNGVNKQFKPISDRAILNECQEKYGLPDKFLLHFANTAPKKNTIGVLHAYKLYIAGVAEPLPLVLTDCTTHYIKTLLKQIDAPDLIEHIRILDYVSFNNIPSLYNLATLFLYPSHRESFGMPIIEAMACGVPVITSNTSALPEIAGGAASLIDPQNPRDIYEQFLKLLTDPVLYQEMREKGFRNAKRFSWENAARETEAVYNELAQISEHKERVVIHDTRFTDFKMEEQGL